MAKFDAKPDNLPCAEFEDFTCADSNSAKLTVTKRRLYGALKSIKAHAGNSNLVVRYERIQDIEVVSGTRKSFGETVSEDCYAVTFSAKLKLTDVSGKELKSPRGSDITHITYWNFTERDFLNLNFLRHRDDKQLFLEAYGVPANLFRIASHHLGKDAQTATAAYQRAVSLVKSLGAPDTDGMAAFVAYIAQLLKRETQLTIDCAIAEYRRLDQWGNGAPELALLMSKHGAVPDMLSEILNESLARLLKRKPKKHSASLKAILDIVLKEELDSPAPESLLWQTYLAAAAERELTVLKHIWARAVKMKADRETLEMIYKTWRGFSELRPAIGPNRETRRSLKGKNAV